MSKLDELLSLPGREDNQYVEEWKDAGGRVIGLVCSYVPEEIIHACGMLPYRVEARGCTDTCLADVYLHRFNCTYARCLLEMGLAGSYGFLDGFCMLNGCDQIRRLYDIWTRYVDTDYMYMVTVPHYLYDAGFEWYKEELYYFREHLLDNFGARCTDDSLRHAADVYNRSRRLIRELYDLRRSEHPPISGCDAMKILLSSYIMPRDKYNDLLEGALAEIGERDPISDYKARIMLGGSACDDHQLIEIIEDLGAVVVTDSLCYGSKHFLDLVEEDGDPLEEIARRYYYHNPCPRMMKEYDLREQYIEDRAREADVDGIILEKIVFCDTHGVDNPMLVEELEAKGIPAMNLEIEYMLSDVGRLKTRIEAFLERIARR
ncbi:MAG: 2-hydroxyacyl-CoA dehydratase family protein [Actinomycetota bacterium]|nr:2-hydroxyacyl-CoA dehydratase family protein [Actinomycetota bacterium]